MSTKTVASRITLRSVKVTDGVATAKLHFDNINVGVIEAQIENPLDFTINWDNGIDDVFDEAELDELEEPFILEYETAEEAAEETGIPVELISSVDFKKTELRDLYFASLVAVAQKKAKRKAWPMPKASGETEAPKEEKKKAKKAGKTKKTSKAKGTSVSISKNGNPEPGIGDFIKTKLLNTKMTKDTILEKAIETFPGSTATKKDVSWYAWKLKKDGHTLGADK